MVAFSIVVSASVRDRSLTCSKKLVKSSLTPSFWCLPGSIHIDPVINGKDGNALPETHVDYIFSSHCLEHFNNWVTGLEHWVSRIKPGGILLLYLPDYSQEYWRPWNNRKHKHIMNPGHIADMLTSLNMTVTVTGVDLNNSFAVLAIKNEL